LFAAPPIVEILKKSLSNMTAKVKPIPDGYHAVTAYLIVSDAAKAIEFYKQAFNATEIARMARPDGKLMHADLQIGDSRIMIADECPEMAMRSPQTLGGSPVALHLYVEDSDLVIQRAAAAGAKVIRPIQDQFYGDRAGMIADPFGHIWNIGTHKEDLTWEEIKQRAAARFNP
jgi:PhnB protein